MFVELHGVVNLLLEFASSGEDAVLFWTAKIANTLHRSTVPSFRLIQFNSVPQSASKFGLSAKSNDSSVASSRQSSHHHFVTNVDLFYFDGCLGNIWKFKILGRKSKNCLSVSGNMNKYLLLEFLDTFKWRLLDAFRVVVDWYPLEELGYLETRFKGTNKPGSNNTKELLTIVSLYYEQ